METIKLKSGGEVNVFLDGDGYLGDIGAVLIREHAFCEHCMDLEAHDPVIFDGGVFWCLDCADVVGDKRLSEVVDDDEAMQRIEELSRQEKKRYFQEALDSLG